MKKDKDLYTIFFALMISTILGLILSVITFRLKPLQEKNKKNENLKNILKSIDINYVNDKNINFLYKKFIKKIIIVNDKGDVIKSYNDNYNINIKNIKDFKTAKMPIYIAYKENKNYYIIPLLGMGLWGEIYGYLSIDNHLKLSGIILDHKSETPGLGAEISKEFFLKLFKGENILNQEKIYNGIKIVKGNRDPNNTDKEDNKIDGISGATKTCDGVSIMITKYIKFYLPYLKKIAIKDYN